MIPQKKTFILHFVFLSCISFLSSTTSSPLFTSLSSELLPSSSLISHLSISTNNKRSFRSTFCNRSTSVRPVEIDDNTSNDKVENPFNTFLTQVQSLFDKDKNTNKSSTSLFNNSRRLCTVTSLYKYCF